MSQSQPPVPPRPTRSQASANAPSALPSIPPRPARRDDRSESPHYPRSPLNESPFPIDSSSELQRVASLNASKTSFDLPQRPPSVSLPSIGQEGSEYDARAIPDEEAVGGLEDGPGTSPKHTRKVSQDLPLHAPRPSLSSSDAKQRVAAVVRTDSNQASVATGQKQPATLKARSSFQRPSSAASHDRPGSAYDDEHRIPAFGIQVPLGNHYGDVQAPSPAPGSHPQTPGTPGFDSSRPGTGRNHARKHSGRNDFHAPPGSYGLHGHGVHDASDQFEKDWLKKHPDVQREELAAHSPAIIDRHDYNLTPEQLNKLVKQSRKPGFGASSHVSMPDEQIGYLVSEKYSSQAGTPTDENFKPTLSHAPHADSPLKRSSMATEELEKAALLAAAAKTIQVDAPVHKESKHIGRGQASAGEHVDLGPRGGNTSEQGGWHDESGYGVPILASDEIDPSGSYLQPAVPPERRASLQDYSHSQPSSRPGSIHNVPVMSREGHHTLLDDVREYEPLFPEDEKSDKRPSTAAERFKQRPDMKQRFPSRDIWEDAPESVNMSATVETPEEEPSIVTKPAFETPEAESARKGEFSEQERAQLLPREVRLAQSQFKPHLKQDTRPGAQRFPSRDIWEDSPDSTYITTTVDDEEEARDLAEEAGAVVQTSSDLPREGATAGAPVISPEASARPMVPPRPARGSSPGKAGPQIPARPARRPSPQQDKPIVPVRPNKAAQISQNDGSAEPEASSRSIDPSAAKTKPPVPARPVGGKIAALQAGFMSDLNKKLGLGPQGPPPKKEEEPISEEDKKPLEDARKGRARGPARRKPAASPSASATAKPESRKFVATPVFSMYDISPSGALTATYADNWEEKLKFKDGLDDTAEKISTKTDAPVAQEVAPAAGFNTAGESVHVPTVTPEAVRATAQTESTPAVAAEPEVSAGPDDISETAHRQEIKTGVQDPEEGAALTKQRTMSSGTQTGETNLVFDKNGKNEHTVTAYKNGSAHEEGYAFAEGSEQGQKAKATEEA